MRSRSNPVCRNLGYEVTKFRPEYNHKVKDDLNERNGLQVCFDLMASQLLEVCSTLTAACEQIELHCGRLTASHLWLESLLLFLIYGSVDRAAAW